MIGRELGRVLIANRGEVAVRIATACRARGIESVAVYSEADRDSPHVDFADLAFALPGVEARETYLAKERLLDLAKQAEVDAVHPGYGFLAESASFAEAVSKSGMKFIGPAPDVIATMGDKRAARELVKHLGLPVIPGANPQEQDEDALCDAAERVGFPLLLKAAAGGGGMGMRVVYNPKDLPRNIAAVRREASAAFGDTQLLLERFIADVHHVEVQIIGDALGNIFHAFERECSIQRRRQKVIEEAPSPNVDDELRSRLCNAALAIARAVEYEGLGTVEFIVDAKKREFYFLEMNTRLQVEHAVTEAITGLDLVDLQLSVAEGKPLPTALEHLVFHGHAMEARLYAEDPASGYLPSDGRLERWVPCLESGTRVMASVKEGSTVHAFYDPMLAKFVAHGASRQQACRSLRYSLSQSGILGVQTNRELLLRVLNDDEFKAGKATTSFLEQREDLGTASRMAHSQWLRELPVLAFWEWLRDQASVEGLGRSDRSYHYLGEGGRELVLKVRRVSAVAVDVEAAGEVSRLTVMAHGLDQTLLIDQAGRARHYYFGSRGDERYLCARGGDTMRATLASPDHLAPTESSAGHYMAPMPARVLMVDVEAGDRISAGDSLCVLESMKMEHTLSAKTDGTVATISVAIGDSVERGQELLSVEQSAS